jgi:hypothetical protein
VDLNTRLRIATRIHFALLRHLGEGVDVAKMLKHEDQAREVLWVCEASGDAELVALGQQYQRAATLEEESQLAAGHTQQETLWARDTSGFGISQPPELTDVVAVPRRRIPTLTVAVMPRTEMQSSDKRATGWMNPANWLRRAQH